MAPPPTIRVAGRESAAVLAPASLSPSTAQPRLLFHPGGRPGAAAADCGLRVRLSGTGRPTWFRAGSPQRSGALPHGRLEQTRPDSIGRPGRSRRLELSTPPEVCRTASRPHRSSCRVGGRRQRRAAMGRLVPGSSRRHLEPCVRFSRTRLSDVLHRRHSAMPASPGWVWARRRCPRGRSGPGGSVTGRQEPTSHSCGAGGGAWPRTARAVEPRSH
jgi:hypothetical protein